MRYVEENRGETNGERTFLALPQWSDFDPRRQLEELRVLLSEGRALADAQASSFSSRSSEPLFLSWERFHDRVGKAWGPVAHLYAVDQESYPGIEEVYEEGERILSEFSTEIGHHEGLYQAYRALKTSDAYETLDEEEKRIVDRSISDFELSGVTLSPEKKARMREANARISALSTRFSQNLQEAQNAWSLHFPDDSRLGGISLKTKEAMRDAAMRERKEGFLVTVHQPIYAALIEQANDRELRRMVYEAYHTRASDQGPLAGKYDNGPLMREIVSLRNDVATLLGFPNYNAFRLKKRMAPSVGDVSSFLSALEARAVPAAKTEFATLREFARKELGMGEILPWDVAYVARIMKEREYGIDQEELRTYFPEDRVFEELFLVLGRLYGVTFTERKDVPTWKPGIRFFEVADGERLLGGVYADLYARRGKRPGAWMDSAIERFRFDGKVQLPIAYFNCNFLPQKEGRATLRHDEIETIFHEFGHVIHHILSEANYPSTGMGSVEWDAVEFPSQILENWCWKPEVLREMGADIRTRERIPDKLVERLAASRLFHVGMFLARQLTLGIFDWELHLRAAQCPDVQKLWDEIQERMMPLPYPSWSRYPNAFSHIFDGGYAAGYYSYLWAEVLSADAFSVFEEHGVFDRKIGRKFRQEILAPGSSRPMMEGFRAFRGREPDPSALFRSYGMAG